MTREECVALLYRYAEYDGIGIPNLAGCKDAMKMAADLLSQPSLPSNLDEAAERYAWIEEEPLLDGERLSFCFNPRIDAFKIGAEWMAKQGETQEHFVIGSIAGSSCGPAIVCYTKEFAIGDEVIVQIRKKEE